MFGLAILAMLFRTSTRLYFRRRLQLDDALLLFGTACLIASTVILYRGTHAVFLVQALSMGPTVQIKGPIMDFDTVNDQVTLFQKTTWIFVPLAFTTIFAVKFGFLSFFRHLVDHLPRLHMYWRCVVVFTAAVYVFAIIDVFLACSRLGLIGSCRMDIPSRTNTC